MAPIVAAGTPASQPRVVGHNGRVTSLTDAERLARRYPPKRTPRWLWIPLAAALGAVLLLWTGWAGWHAAHPDVAAQVVGFKVVSDTQIDVQVTVQRDHQHLDRAVDCEVSAQAISYDTVGQLPFTWASGGAELQTDWVSVRTFKRAVSAKVDYCRIAG